MGVTHKQHLALIAECRRLGLSEAEFRRMHHRNSTFHEHITYCNKHQDLNPSRGNAGLHDRLLAWKQKRSQPMNRVQQIRETRAIIEALGFSVRYEDGCYCLRFGPEPGNERDDSDDYVTDLASDVIEVARWEAHAREMRERSRKSPLVDRWRWLWGVS
jgi:hypothetical protein